MLYFMGASIWGCICGLAALLAGLELSGRPLQIDGTLVLLLVVALLGASFGGALTCMAYREVVGRGTR